MEAKVYFDKGVFRFVLLEDGVKIGEVELEEGLVQTAIQKYGLKYE